MDEEQIDRLNERMADIEEQIAEMARQTLELVIQVAELSSLVKVRTRPTKASFINVCALDASRDSTVCDDATVYRYQQGCRGVNCVSAYKDYYTDYRLRKRSAGDPEPDTVE